MYPVWLWPNLLSLDAPVVAVAWHILLARAFHRVLNPAAVLLLAATVWTIYAVDRVLDARAGGNALAPRHEFALAHRTAFLVVIPAAVVLIAALSVFELPGVIEWRGLLVGSCVAAYLFWVHRRSVDPQPRLKALAVAVVFAAGVVLPFRRIAGLELAAAGIVVLAWLNIVAIDSWEAGRAASAWTAPVAVLLAALAITNEFFAALSASAFVLVALDRWRAQLSRDLLRVCADLALLVPTLMLLLS